MKSVSKNIYWIILIQSLIIMIIIGATAYTSKNQKITTIDLSKCESEYSSYNGEEFYFDETIIDGEDWKDALVCSNISLKEGSYTLYIEYDCNADKRFELHDGTITNSCLRNTQGFLRNENNVEAFKFSTIVPIDNFQVCIKYQPYGYLRIKDISIATNNIPLKKLLLAVVVFFIVFDLCCINKSKLPACKGVILGIAGIAFVSSFPLFISSIADGHDIVFSLIRIEGDYIGVKNGSFPVRMNTLALRGYGYPVSIYYGDVFLYFPVVLRLFGFSLVDAWKWYIFTVNIATAVTGYLSFCKMIGNKKIALIMSLTYSVAPYRLSNIYIRAACGEFTAMTFYPMIAMAIYNIYSEEMDKERIGRYSTYLAIGVSCVVCTHILSTLMLCFVLILISLLFIRKTLQKSVLITLSLSVIKTVLLSAFFIVPFIDYYINVPTSINETVANETKVLQLAGAYLTDFISINHNITPDGRIPASPGFVLIVGLAIAFICILNGSKDKHLVFLGVMSTFLLLISSNIFPWDFCASHFTLGRILAQIQLPTRFIGLATLFLTCLLGKVMIQMKNDKCMTQLLFVIFVFSTINTSLFTDNYEKGRKVVAYTNTSNLDTMSLGRGEYVLKGTNINDDYTHDINENNEGIVLLYDKSGTSLTLTCSNLTEEAKKIIIPRYNYKNYHVYDDSGSEYEILNEVNNLIAFMLPEKYSGNIYLVYVEPWYWRMSEIVTFVMILWFMYRALKPINLLQNRKCTSG